VGGSGELGHLASVVFCNRGGRQRLQQERALAAAAAVAAGAGSGGGGKSRRRLDESEA